MPLSTYEYALFASHVYNYPRAGETNESSNNNIHLPDGWTEITFEALSTAFWGEGSSTDIPFFNQWGDGFYAKAYEKDNEIVIAFRGTDDLEDWTTSNIASFLGEASEQYLHAFAFVKAVQAYAGAAKSIVGYTGHSLGGGLATEMAVYFGEDAKIFAPRLSNDSALDGAAGKEYEVLSDDLTAYEKADIAKGSESKLLEIFDGEITISPFNAGDYIFDIPSVSPTAATVNAYTIQEEILNYLGIGQDRGAKTLYSVGDIHIDYDIPWWFFLAPELAILDNVTEEAIALHSINLHALMVALDELGGNATALPNASQQFPTLIPAFFDPDVIGTVDPSEGQTFLTELLNLITDAATRADTLQALINDFQKLIDLKEANYSFFADNEEAIINLFVGQVAYSVMNDLFPIGLASTPPSFFSDQPGSVFLDISRTQAGMNGEDAEFFVDYINDFLMAEFNRDEGEVITPKQYVIRADFENVKGVSIDHVQNLFLSNKSAVIIGTDGGAEQAGAGNILIGGNQDDVIFGDWLSSGIAGDGDIIHGEGGNDILSGQYGEDEIHGGAGSDTITGGLGKDTLKGDDGSDILMWDIGEDEMDGGDDTDSIDFGLSPMGIFLDLSTGEFTITVNDEEETDTLISIEGIRGTDQKDIFIGDENANIIEGRDGDDIIIGETDIIIEDADSTIEDLGIDTLIGGDGDDQLVGGSLNVEIPESAMFMYYEVPGAAVIDDKEEDVFIGGEGADSFYVGDKDIIKDPDDTDRVFFEGTQLTGATQDEFGNFVDEYGNTYSESDGTLTITTSDDSVIVIENYGFAGINNANAGITLIPYEKDPNEDENASPLVLDLNGDGILTSSQQSSGVFFDIDNDGFAERSGWISAGDGFLVYDANNDGLINNQSELFGNGFVADPVSLQRIEIENGFDSLARFDINSDGVFDNRDAEWSNVQVWQDFNGNGRTEDGELLSLDSLDITSISLNYNEGDVDQNGNEIREVSTFEYGDGTQGQIADVWFRYDPKDTQEIDTSDVIENPDLDLLPFIKGFGETSNLYVAMARDPLLQEMVTKFVEDIDSDLSQGLTNLFSETEAILFRWYGVDDIEGDSRGPNINGQQLSALDAYRGYDFFQKTAGLNPRPEAAADLQESWREHAQKQAFSLFLQTEAGQAMLPNFEVVSYGIRQTGNFDYDEFLSQATSAVPTDSIEALSFWKTIAVLSNAIAVSTTTEFFFYYNI